MFSIKEAIDKLEQRKSLNREEAHKVFLLLMSGKVSDLDLANFLTALCVKKETPQEISGAVMALRSKMLRVNTPKNSIILDNCGTGGSGKNTFSISTTAAFVVSGAGVKVAKHGNRSASSAIGSADALESLGVNINLTSLQAERILKKIGIVFLFAPNFHPAMKFVSKVRKTLGFRTIFNLIGPLCNPALSNVQLIGCYDRSLLEPIAHALKDLKTKRAFVVSGEDALDEITISGKTFISELKNNQINNYYVEPQDFGLKRSDLKNILVSNQEENKKMILGCLKGKSGPALDIVLMNASCCLVAAGRAHDFKEGVSLAKEAIKNHAALEKLELLIKLTNSIDEEK